MTKPKDFSELALMGRPPNKGPKPVVLTSGPKTTATAGIVTIKKGRHAYTIGGGATEKGAKDNCDRRHKDAVLRRTLGSR